jgi:hypothetical protein
VSFKLSSNISTNTYMTRKRLTYPLTDIKKLLHQGLSKEEVLQIVFRKYENTIHHTEYWKYQLQRAITKVDSELKSLNVLGRNHRRHTSKNTSKNHIRHSPENHRRRTSKNHRNN